MGQQTNPPDQPPEQSVGHPQHIIIGAKLIYLAVIIVWITALYMPVALWINLVFKSINR